MRTAPFADGTPQASQWPIPPGHFFDYELHPMIGDAGTYFYHSHVGVQAATVTGALIIDDVYSPPYPYDDEIVFGLQDHYNMTDVAIQAGLVAQPFVWTGESNGIMLNGRSGAFLNSSASSADLTCSPAIITVKANQTYRFRFIGETAISLVTLGIEDHDNFTVIEADGRYTQPFSTDHMQVSTGQRFSVLFKTKTVEELQALNTKYFWIQMENRGRPVNLTSYAILQYDVPELSLPATPVEIPTTKPLTLPSNFSYWLEYSLQPYQGPGYEPFPTLDQVNRTVTISVAQFLNYSDSGTIQWAENGDIWQESRIAQPYLVNIYQNGQSAIPNYTAALENAGWDPQTLAYPAKLGEVIDVVWLNDNGFSGGWDIHPFHGHSDHYWDLGSGNGTYDAVENAQKMNDMNYTPVLRDTTMLYRYATSGVPQTVAGWRAWRLNITNPGVWMLHCHILPHMIMGKLHSSTLLAPVRKANIFLPNRYADSVGFR